MDLELLQGTRVLLVEDDPVNQTVAVGLLEAVGMRVDVAWDGAEAVAMVEQDKGYEVVLMDVQMPIMDGITATRRIRDNPKFEELPIVALTASVMRNGRDACVNAGMNDFVGKPFSPEQLYSTIQKWVTGLCDADLLGSPTRERMAGADLWLPAQIEGLDVRAGLRRVAGMKRIYIDALRKYLDGTADVAERLRRQIATGEMETAVREAHTLKGGSGMVEARDIHDLARTVEMVLKGGDMPAALALIDKLDTALCPLREGIRRALAAVGKQ